MTITVNGPLVQVQGGGDVNAIASAVMKAIPTQLKSTPRRSRRPTDGNRYHNQLRQPRHYLVLSSIQFSRQLGERGNGSFTLIVADGSGYAPW